MYIIYFYSENEGWHHSWCNFSPYTMFRDMDTNEIDIDANECVLLVPGTTSDE